MASWLGPTGVPQHGGAGAVLIFEFWNDSSYQAFKPTDAQFLVDRFHDTPVPTDVKLAGGRYVLTNFNQVAEGRCSQSNTQSSKERHVRLKPPYALPGKPHAKLPGGGLQFLFQDDHLWRAYNPSLQFELMQAARSAPPPERLFFVEDSKVYLLLGLDSLVNGTPEMWQVNVRTQKMRKVTLNTGAAVPVSPPVVQPPAPPTRSSGHGGRFFSRLFPGGPGGGSSSSSSSGNGLVGHAAHFNNNCSHVDVAGEFSVRNMVFRPGPAGRLTCSGGSDKLPVLSAEANVVLRRAWMSVPRPDEVTLPSGDIVYGFQNLEVKGAVLQCAGNSNGAHHVGPFSLPRMHRGDTRLPLELHIPLPQAGSVVLPNELDIETARSALPFGRFLSNQEVARLPERGKEANVCSICLDSMEPEGDESDPDIAMAPLDVSPNNGGVPVEMGSVFELNCKHAYHRACIDHWFQTRRRCPQCQRDFGKVVGDQPRRGTLQWHLESYPLPGHQDTDKTIVIQFDFPSGTTSEGVSHAGRKPKGYLPGNSQGIVLLELFKVAFRRCVMFGLGNSMSTGAMRPTFNIHESGTCLQTFACHDEEVCAVAFAPDGGSLATASGEGSSLWLWQSATCVRTFAGHVGRVRCVAFGLDGHGVVTASDDCTAKLWSRQSGQCVRTLRGHRREVLMAVFSPVGKAVVTASADGEVKLWSAISWEELHTLSGHRLGVLSASFAPNNQAVVTASRDGTAKLWSVETGRCLKTFRGHTGTVRSAAFSPQ